MQCWEGYWDSPETGKWDCDLTTFMATPFRGGIPSSGDHIANAGSLLFEKKYDGLEDPVDGLSNVLNGTCEMGQLLRQGYDQQMANGNILREAYAYRAGEYDHDERMRLLDLSGSGGKQSVDEIQIEIDDELLPWHPKNLYFRADDYQRTVMSGQILLKGLFGTEMAAVRSKTTSKTNTKTNTKTSIVLPLHIADEEKDIVDANENVCPKLRSLKDEALASDDYQQFFDSDDSKQIRDYMEQRAKMGDGSSVLDCFMCTLCTDRSLPSVVDDYDGTTDNWFSRLTEYEIQKYTKVMKHNKAAYAKLGIGPLWYEIMKHINKVVSGDGDGNGNGDGNVEQEQEQANAPKLALFAGHDTTLMPLLASLGPDLWKDTEWAPYASMMLIEIHELIDGRSDPTVYQSRFAFRLLYNGNILTPLVEGCHADCELCDVIHLKAVVDPIATRDADCSAKPGDAGTVGMGAGANANENANANANANAKDTTTRSGGSSAGAGAGAGTKFRPTTGAVATTTLSAVSVALIVLSGLGGSLATLAVMRKRFALETSQRRVDFGGAWDIDDNDNDNGGYGLELTEGGSFRDEPGH